jgi:hypothetical protein
MKLNSWFEISELEYAQYRLQGYQIEADSERVCWYLNNWLHRTDGPAYIGVNGYQGWYLNGKLHRTDGAAVIWDGTQEWYLNGNLHREDGPASIGANGTQEWYLNGKELTESEWQNAVSQLG